jgi:hypothetical protein
MDPEIIDAAYIDIGKLVAFLNAEFGEREYDLDSEVCTGFHQRPV